MICCWSLIYAPFFARSALYFAHLAFVAREIRARAAADITLFPCDDGIDFGPDGPLRVKAAMATLTALNASPTALPHPAVLERAS